jgi:type IV pilus assembly protein PilX
MNQVNTQRERGVVLVIALIFLVILTLLGTIAANVTGLEERMAGNTRDRDLALEAAEAALQDAATRMNNDIGGQTASQFRASATTLAAMTPNDANYWKARNWGTANSITQTLNQVAEQPSFFVERRAAAGTTEYYRVTARGIGGNSNAIVILQAEYSYNPPGP